jgi:hypothetical protein
MIHREVSTRERHIAIGVFFAVPVWLRFQTPGNVARGHRKAHSILARPRFTLEHDHKCYRQVIRCFAMYPAG